MCTFHDITLTNADPSTCYHLASPFRANIKLEDYETEIQFYTN